MERHLSIEEHLLWNIIHQTVDSLVRYEDKTVANLNLTKQQYLILWMLEFMSENSDEPIKLSDLSVGYLRTLNSISTIVDRMEKNGLLRKYRDLPDQRSIRLVITHKGMETFNSTQKMYNTIIREILSVFSPEEMNTFLSMLIKLRERLFENGKIEKLSIDPEKNDPEPIIKFLNRHAF